jgi:hypothetical protein
MDIVTLRSAICPRCETLTIALAALALVGCGSAEKKELNGRATQADPGVLSRFSNAGEPYATALSGDQQVLQRLAQDGRETSRILRLGQRDGRVFYRLDAECFATGPVLPATQSFSAIACSPQFPSPAQPILDFTVFRGASTRADERPTKLTVYRSEGFAADGVGSVALVDEAGAVVADTEVVDNTYSFEPTPSGENLRIAAFSRRGERIFEQPKRASTPSS